MPSEVVQIHLRMRTDLVRQIVSVSYKKLNSTTLRTGHIFEDLIAEIQEQGIPFSFETKILFI